MKKNMKKIEASSLCEASSCVTASYRFLGRRARGWWSERGDGPGRGRKGQAEGALAVNFFVNSLSCGTTPRTRTRPHTHLHYGIRVVQVQERVSSVQEHSTDRSAAQASSKCAVVRRASLTCARPSIRPHPASTRPPSTPHAPSRVHSSWRPPPRPFSPPPPPLRR